jgi:hypothetical protein
MINRNSLRVLLLTFLSSASLACCAIAQQTKLAERLDELEVEAANIGECFEVYYVRQVAGDETALGMGNVFTEDLARLAMSKSGQHKRMDGLRRQTTDHESEFRGHYLFSKGNWSKAGGNAPVATVKKLAQDQILRTDFPDFNPLRICLGTELDFRRGARSRAQGELMKAKTVAEGTTKDGSYYGIIVSSKGLGGVKIEFLKEPKWAPRQVTFLVHRGKAVDINKVTEKDVASWHVLARTATEWEEVKENKWVPKRVLMSYESGNNVKYESETRFAGWKFGKDVQQDIFDEKKFTGELLARTVNFAEWEQEYFAHKKRK